VPLLQLGIVCQMTSKLRLAHNANQKLLFYKGNIMGVVYIRNILNEKVR